MLTLPDSPLVSEARALAAAALPGSILDHSTRTFLLGRAVGRRRGLVFDEEGLCLAAMFHDLGLVDPDGDPALPFPMRSSRVLTSWLQQRGVPEERISAQVDAIDFHMQLFPRWSKGNLAGLLHIGAWMDATGRRKRHVRVDADAIADAIPRGDFDRLFRRHLVGSFTSVRACVGLFVPWRRRT